MWELLRIVATRTLLLRASLRSFGKFVDMFGAEGNRCASFPHADRLFF